MEIWKPLKFGKSGECHQYKNIIRKTYTNHCKERMSNEINALTLLRKYKYFPKIIKIDWNNYMLYMTYVGKSIKKKKRKELPKNLFQQLNEIEIILKKEGIHHNDLALGH